jgi:multiple sugar transport system substrate-binding protein
MASAADITLRYMSWDPTQLEKERPAIAAFEAAHPGVHIQAQALPPSDYWPRVSAMAAAKDLPDVMMMSSGYIQQWVEAGNLVDLGTHLDEGTLAGYNGNAVATARFGNGLFAVPQSWSGPVLFYNKTAFDAAGVSYPSANWSWADFLNAARTLTKDTNGDGYPEQWGYWIYGRYAQVDGWVFRNGGRYLNEAGTALEPNEAAVNALRFLTDLTITEKVAPRPQDLQGVRQQDAFPLGMAAMWVDGSWNISNIRTVAGDSFQWGIAEIPAGPDATPQTLRSYAWPDMLSVGSGSKHEELAVAFIRFMTGEGRSPSDFLGGKVPAFDAIAAQEDWLERNQQPDNKAVLLQIGRQALYTGFSRSWDAWRGYGASGSAGVNGELDEVFNGRKSLDEAIASFVAYANDVMKR